MDYYPYFTEEKAEVLTGEATCTGSHATEVKLNQVILSVDLIEFLSLSCFSSYHFWTD